MSCMLRGIKRVCIVAESNPEPQECQSKALNTELSSSLKFLLNAYFYRLNLLQKEVIFAFNIAVLFIIDLQCFHLNLVCII